MAILTDKLAWQGSALTVPDDATLERLDRKRLSPSASKTIGSCPARYVADTLLHDDPGAFDPRTLGSASHKVLEILFGLPESERTEAAAMGILSDIEETDEWGEKVKTLSPDERALWRTKVANNVTGDFALEDPTSIETYAQEMWIKDVEIEGVPFSGIVDRLDVKARRAKSTDLTVVDYKTGKDKSKPNPRFSDDHGDQIRLYKLAVEAHFRNKGENVRVASGRLNYITAQTKRQVALSKKSDIDDTAREFRDNWDLLKRSVESRSFETKPQPLCGWCPLVNSCPAAARAGRRASDKKPALSAEELGIGVSEKMHDSVQSVTIEVSSEAPEKPRKDTGMTDNKRLREGKPWDGPFFEDDTPNFASNTFLTVGDYHDMAFRELVNANPEVKKTQIRDLADSFIRIVADVQEKVSGSRDLDRALNTRLRFHLKAILRYSPPPLGHAEAEWSEWAKVMRSRLTALVRLDVDTAGGSFEDVDEPWKDSLTKEAGYTATPWQEATGNSTE